MKVKREEFLQILQDASVGLSQREILEQSNSFVFHDGFLVTFNDEILVRLKSPLDFDVIVSGDDLMKVLTKFPDEEVSITRRKSEVILKGKKRSAGITCSSDIFLPFESVPHPKKWTRVKKDAAAMMRQAARVCGRDETQYLTTCVHVCPDKVEACDNFRMFRAKGPTGFSQEVLIPAAHIDALGDLTPDKVSIDKGWVHFQLSSGMEVSLRCSHEKYHEGMDKLLKIKNGEKVILPANLADIVDRVTVMNEGGYDSRVNLHIEKGKLQILSRKETGWYKERKRIKYSGPDLTFDIHPRFLIEILERTRKVLVGSNRIKIAVGDIQFVAAMTIAEETEGEE